MKKWLKQILCLFMIYHFAVGSGSGNFQRTQDVDLIVFSYNRPLQLYCFLESAKHYITGLAQIYVLYRSGNQDFEKAYLSVKNSFSNEIFCNQSFEKNGTDFKDVFLDIFSNKSKSEYIIFAVDDIIVTDFINVGTCVEALEKTNAYGFYLRAGKNITENINLPLNVHVEEINEIVPGIFAWNFKDGSGGVWRYPNTVDMTIYRKKDITAALNNLNYKSPNTLEGMWGKNANLDLIGLCFEKSKIVNVPLNLVQQNWKNKYMDGFEADKLLAIFQKGLKIDIKQLHNINNKAPHIFYGPKFVSRSDEFVQPVKNIRKFVVVTASYNNIDFVKKNLDSIFSQKCDGKEFTFRMIYCDDASTDGTGEFVEAYKKEFNLGNKLCLIRNKTRIGGHENIYNAVHSCDNDEVVLIVDGDDWLARDDVFMILNKVYSDSNVWLTYGQYRRYPDGVPGICKQIPENIIKTNTFRSYAWVSSHLRTFYAWLYKRIKKEDIMFEGKFVPFCGDQAIMLPMLEMAGAHSRFVSEVLYIYNFGIPGSFWGNVAKKREEAMALGVNIADAKIELENLKSQFMQVKSNFLNAKAQVKVAKNNVSAVKAQVKADRLRIVIARAKIKEARDKVTLFRGNVKNASVRLEMLKAKMGEVGVKLENLKRKKRSKKDDSYSVIQRHIHKELMPYSPLGEEDLSEVS